MIKTKNFFKIVLQFDEKSYKKLQRMANQHSACTVDYATQLLLNATGDDLCQSTK